MQRRTASQFSLLGWLVVASIATIAVALGFEHIGGYRPCPLCLMERYAYYFAIVAGTAGLAAARLLGLGGRWLQIVIAVIAVGYLINAGLGAYHAGVEWKWWAGPDTCSGALPKLSVGPLDLDKPVIRCDAAPWTFAKLSFAGWNAIISATLAVIALAGALRPGRAG